MFYFENQQTSFQGTIFWLGLFISLINENLKAHNLMIGVTKVISLTWIVKKEPNQLI